MRYLAVSLCLSLGLYATAGQAASFDCAKAAHPLEKTICADVELSKLDEQVAARYREKRDLLFDKQAFTTQQREWQKILRLRCQSACDGETVKQDYQQQLATLQSLKEEIYSASYKTPDVATLTITHLDAKQFDFTLRRDYPDQPDEPVLCLLPANDAEAGAIATRTGADSALWTNGEGCTLKFAFIRGDGDTVTTIELSASDGCGSYCPGGNFTLNDRFIPENYWVAGNQ